jgi:hypothetical protein
MIDILIGTLIGFAICQMLLSWFKNKMQTTVANKLKRTQSCVDSGPTVLVTVEAVQNQFLCYNAFTQDFVCQGSNIKEIGTMFAARFPNKELVILDTESDVVDKFNLVRSTTDQNVFHEH